VPASSKTKTQPKILVLEAPSLGRIPWLTHGFSTRQGGHSLAYGRNSLNLGFTSHDTKAAVIRNRQGLAASLSKRAKSTWELVTARQIHSDLIRLIDGVPRYPLAGDGLITATPGLLLAVLTADCFPVILVDPKHRAIGVFHAGWRGTVKRIVEGCGGAQNAFQLLMLEHLPELAATASKAIANVKFDKVVVWDGGTGGKNAAANFLQGLAGGLPPMLQMMRDIGGVEMPQFLGKLVGDGSRPAPAADGVATAAATPTPKRTG